MTLRASSDLISEENPPSGSNGEETNDKKLADILKTIVEAVDEGRENDLTDAGFAVRKRTAKEIIDMNIGNKEVAAKILGSMDSEEEVDICRALQSAQQEITSAAAPTEIPNDLLADLKSEAIGIIKRKAKVPLHKNLG